MTGFSSLARRGLKRHLFRILVIGTSRDVIAIGDLSGIASRHPLMLFDNPDEHPSFALSRPLAGAPGAPH